MALPSMYWIYALLPTQQVQVLFIIIHQQEGGVIIRYVVVVKDVVNEQFTHEWIICIVVLMDGLLHSTKHSMTIPWNTGVLLVFWWTRAVVVTAVFIYLYFEEGGT